MIKAIETRYAGCRFRSRLEARWAVFFDRLGIAWEYEPQGYVIDGRSYLPDFLLPECGTWIEVKGSEALLDRDLLRAAALHLPQDPGLINHGPALMILGPIPEPTVTGDWHWTGFDTTPFLSEDTPSAHLGSYGFGLFHYRFERACPSQPHGYLYLPPTEPDAWLTPRLRAYDVAVLDGTLAHLPESAFRAPNGVRGAYEAARSARFEHGESGAR